MKARILAIPATFIWIGFVLAISFMEAWLKFKAPGITVPLGLGIGRLVFFALNKVELVLAAICLFAFFSSHPKDKIWLFYFIPLAILLLQTFWMLPTLDARALQLLDGQELPKSNLHFAYIIVEFVKVVCLLIFGFSVLKGNLRSDTH